MISNGVYIVSAFYMLNTVFIYFLPDYMSIYVYFVDIIVSLYQQLVISII